MKISKWKKSNEILELQEAWLSTVNVETSADGRPHTCIISIARYDEGGNIVTKIIEFNTEEMFKIAMTDWHIKTHEYANRVMSENRESLDL